MARIACFSDNAAIMRIVQQGLGAADHIINLLPASQLTDGLRQAVQSFSPDVILLELSHAMDNPHIFFFLRSDATTRNTPIILVSAGTRLEQQAAILGADGYLQRPFATEQLVNVMSRFLAPMQFLAA
jgi:CheY-like chemotaxis protein